MQSESIQASIRTQSGLDWSMLSRLVQDNIDSAYAFKAAQELIVSRHLRELFQSIEQERSQNCEELKRVIESFGIEYELPREQSIAASMHKWWTKLRSSMSSDELYAVLDELEHEETYLQKYYDKVLDNSLHPGLINLLKVQLDRIRERHEEIRAARALEKARYEHDAE